MVQKKPPTMVEIKGPKDAEVCITSVTVWTAKARAAPIFPAIVAGGVPARARTIAFAAAIRVDMMNRINQAAAVRPNMSRGWAACPAMPIAAQVMTARLAVAVLPIADAKVMEAIVIARVNALMTATAEPLAALAMI